MTRPPFIHEKALVETDRLGEGTRIWAFAHVMRDVTIGRNCNVGDHCFVESQVTIGDDVTLKNGVALWQHVHVEDGVFIGPYATLTNDRFPRSRAPWQPVETWIEAGATIGANATIVCGVRLGKHCLVAAGAVVTRDVPPHAVVRGNPARQRGWVCHCARPLKPAPGGDLLCPGCGSRFAEGPSGLEGRR